MMQTGEQSKPYDISVIIPNWNGLNYLPECLASLQNQTFKGFEVIVVDNGSMDGSVPLIKTSHPWVKLIELSKNTGFASACNTGIRAAQGRYIALLNNDTEVMSDWLGNLFRTASRDATIGMVASKILLSLKTRKIDSVGMLLYPDGIGRQRGRGEIDAGQFDQEEEILFPSACAALYKREMLQEIGLFDEVFFSYCEDTDLGLRGRLAGWKAVYAPGAVVCHKYSLTGGQYSSFKAMLVERNRIWVGIKNFPLTWVFKIPYHTAIRYFSQLYGVFLSRGSASRFLQGHSTGTIILTVIRAYLSAFKMLWPMLRKRKIIKANQKLSERDFKSFLKKYKISVSELTLKD